MMRYPPEYAVDRALEALWRQGQRTMQQVQLLHGDCRELLDTLEAESVQTIVTSPPYWRMRRYTDDPREIGQEQTPAEYVAALTDVFRQCWRVLRNDGTLWINLGDKYNSGEVGRHDSVTGRMYTNKRMAARTYVQSIAAYSQKQLLGLPWRLAFALQDDGWTLRNDIIWWKRNAMPEGGAAVDRCARDHEYVFLFSKQDKYISDFNAIAEATKTGANGSSFITGKTHAAKAAQASVSQKPRIEKATRHPRTVWDVPTSALADEHYAPMPQELAERCIRAGSAAGDTVLDPFAGSGTTLRAAMVLQRSAIGIDLGYQDMQARRTDGVQAELFV